MKEVERLAGEVSADQIRLYGGAIEVSDDNEASTAPVSEHARRSQALQVLSLYSPPQKSSLCDGFRQNS